MTGPARFTISEVAVDWQEPMVLENVKWWKCEKQEIQLCGNNFIFSHTQNSNLIKIVKLICSSSLAKISKKLVEDIREKKTKFAKFRSELHCKCIENLQCCQNLTLCIKNWLEMYFQILCKSDNTETEAARDDTLYHTPQVSRETNHRRQMAIIRPMPCIALNKTTVMQDCRMKAITVTKLSQRNGSMYC